MDYWEGVMDWPVDYHWHCEVCGVQHPSMTWGFANGQCRCDVCHALYFLKADDGTTVDTPRLWLKPEYALAAKAGWKAWHKPLGDWSDLHWDAALELTKAVSAMKED